MAAQEVIVYAQLVAAGISAVFAFVLLAWTPRRAANLYLAGFLLLIAANQATAGPLGPHPHVLGALAFLFAALDPLVFYYFASLFPARNALNATWKVATVAAGSAVLVASYTPLAFSSPGLSETVLAGWGPDVASAITRLPTQGLAIFTAVVYTVVLLHVQRGLAASPHDRGLSLFLPAVAVAALPAWVRAVPGLLVPVDLGGGAPVQSDWLAAVVLAAWVAAALVLLRFTPRPSRMPEGARRAAFVSAGLGLAMVALVVPDPLGYALSIVGWMDDRWVVFFQIPAVLGVAARWILFGLFTSMAVVGHRMLDMSLASRRHAARVLVAAVFLAGAGGLLVAQGLVAGDGGVLGPGEVVVLGVALVISPLFHRAVERVAVRVYGMPLAADLAARLEAYRTAVVQAEEEGATPRKLQALEILRRELQLDPRTAAVVERMATAPAAGPLVPGQVVAGRYRVGRLLGRGGAGRAFLARDDLLEREVVLKEVPHEYEESETAALAEARLAGSLQHPNIVTVFDVVRTPTASLLVTEYVAGGSLADAVERSGALPLERGLQALDDVLTALEAVHARGVVHRDVKPANVLLHLDGRAKLADFGLARLRRDSTLGGDAAAGPRGTPGFMAPELWNGEPAAPASDLYAVGVLARRCVAGPLPADVEAVVARALAEEPAARWASARAMRDGLRARKGPEGHA